MNESFKSKADKLKIILFVGAVAIFFVIGLLFFLRPEKSENEKRELTKFPDFTIESFLSGEWTNQVSLWFADTYPMREGMISANYFTQSLYGIRNETVTDKGYVKDNAAYQYYTFDKGQSDRYVSLINGFAQKIGNKARVYDMVVPLHYQISPIKDDLMSKNPNASDGKESIDYMYSGLAGNVKKVDAFSEILAHNSEYLYYRTDHHWTARGAYYAYVAFCKQKGISPTKLSEYESCRFEGFLGTLYAENGQPLNLKNDPDYVEAFIPMGTNDISVTDKSGNVTVYSIVNKKTDSWYPAAGAKYNCFIAGDNPISEIHNPNIKNNSSIVIVKESYGNAFVPFLVDSYEHVYVIDYRYWKGSLSDFVVSNGIDDVLFLNVINVTSTSIRLDELTKILN